MASPPILLVAVFIGFPIVIAVAYSLGNTGGLNETIASIAGGQHVAEHWWAPTLGAYRDVFTNAAFRRDLAMTIGVTLLSTGVVVAMAWVIALYVRVSHNWLGRLLSALAVVPMFIPVVIASWAILTFYASDGFIRSIAEKVGVSAPVWGYTVTCVVIGLVWTNLPFATLMIVSGVQSVPDALIEAANDAGASFTRTVRSVIAPMAMVPTVIAATFTAIGTLGSFTVPYFTGPNVPKMLGVDMSSYFVAFNRPQQSVVMAIVVFIIASVFGAFYVWANFRSAQASGRA